MKLLEGQTAFVTGAASGIGLGLARGFARRGLNVMLADIERAALAAAVQQLRDEGLAHVDGVIVDVSDRASVGAAADRTIAAFGKIHILCNNAGVLVVKSVGELTAPDMDWIACVNLMGVVNGVEVFLPRMQAQGEGGHIVNTASMGGLMSIPTYESYSATKFGVVAATEGWREQLAGSGIGMSVLCPGVVTSKLTTSGRNRPDAYGGAEQDVSGGNESLNEVAAGMPPDICADYVVE